MQQVLHPLKFFGQTTELDRECLTPEVLSSQSNGWRDGVQWSRAPAAPTEDLIWLPHLYE